MRRRALLQTLGTTSLGLAGCLGDGSDGGDSTPTPSTTPTETQPPTTSYPDTSVESYTWNGAPDMEHRAAAYPQGSVDPYFVAVLRSTSEASAFRDSYLANSDRAELQEAAAFISDTDHEKQSIVVVQDAKGSSHPDMELEGVRPATTPASTGVHVHARYPGEGATADIIQDNLLVRVPGDPEFARVTLTPQFNDPVTFATQNAIDAPALNEPRALVVRNRDCTEHSVHIQGMVDETLVTREAVDTPAGSIRVAKAVFGHAATYALAASTESTETATTSNVSITTDDPRHVLIDVDGAGKLTISRMDGVPEESRIQCEPEQRPYESSDPSQNIADPVDLWVVSQDAEPRTLTATISDGDTRVFSQTFELSGGYDKAREADLLAKKTTYTLTVEPESGGTLETTFTVAESLSKVTIYVNASGEISVRSS